MKSSKQLTKFIKYCFLDTCNFENIDIIKRAREVLLHFDEDKNKSLIKECDGFLYIGSISKCESCGRYITGDELPAEVAEGGISICDECWNEEE